MSSTSRPFHTSHPPLLTCAPARPQEVTKSKPVDDFMAVTIDFVTSACLFLSDRKYYISDAWINEARRSDTAARCRPRLPAAASRLLRAS